MRHGFWLLCAVGCKSYGKGDPTPMGGELEDELPIEREEPEDCALEAPVTLYLSPDDSNSMSSPVQDREAALAGDNLDWVGIRPWEFLNYYTFDYPRAEPGELSVSLELADGPAPGQYTLQIALTSAPAPSARPPVDLALTIDTSGSMSGEPLQLAQAVGEALAGQLQAGDRLSLVSWSDGQNVLLEDHAVAGPDDPAVLSAIAGLVSDGGTNLSAGLRAGYELLERHQSPERVSRLVLISDGGANLGETDAQLIGAKAGAQDEDGIYLVGVGVGTPQSYHDGLMDQVTDLGQGASVFVPDAAEAERMFGERFASTLTVAARDVQIRLDLPAGFELVRTSAEEVSTDPEQVRPQHLATDDAVVIHQVIESCAGEVPDETALTVHASWLDAETFAPREASLQATFGELLAQEGGLLGKGAAVVAYAEALRAHRDGSTSARAAALEALELAEEAHPGDPDLAEIRAVLEAL
jgi:Ca-activated chloride channel family protein